MDGNLYRILGWVFAFYYPSNAMAQMMISLYVSINGTSNDTLICEIDGEKVEEMMVNYIEENHPELQPLDDDVLIIVPDDF